MIPNDVKLIPRVIDKPETDFLMAQNKAISSVSNNINKLHIQSDLHLINKQNFYDYKQDEIDTLFDEYH